MTRQIGLHTTRASIADALAAEGRNPRDYNITGILRDAFERLDGGRGYRALPGEAWQAAVREHRRGFAIGDLVRVVVGSRGLSELHYGRIKHYRRANGGTYQQNPVEPHSAYVDLPYHSPQIVRLSELTDPLDDFDIVRDFTGVHHSAPSSERSALCLCCGVISGKGAAVMIVHKVSSMRVRLCNGCFGEEELASLGNHVMALQRRSKQIIVSLTKDPGVIAGPDNAYVGSFYRKWADTYPWMVPTAAAEQYARWQKTHRRSSC